MKMDYVASIVAPLITPAAPAFMLMSGLHSGMVASGVNNYVAFVPAAASGIGMEFSGMLAGAMTFRAIKERDLAGGILAGVGVLGYVTFAVMGMTRIANSGVFQSFVLMSLVSYFVAGIYQYFEEKKSTAAKTVVDKIGLIRAETNKLNAEIRKAKVSTGGQTVGQAIGQTVGQAGRQATQFVADPATIAEIAAYWQANPQASLRDCAAFVGCSPMTAGKYRSRVI